MLKQMDKEYRAAVVFYGGVSLAVYENGVARAFFDACRGRGAFAPLLQLLRGRFVVDVISGSSAGGINGLLLATALEHGSEFSQTAKLWREAGGFDDLLRPVNEAEGATSLLRGESYYAEQLRLAFRQLCSSEYGSASEPLSEEVAAAPKEIDVYVTGTDLTGQRGELTGVGHGGTTREHRLMFHMKHRKQRASLGLVNGDGLSGEQKKQIQADVLASVARITSSFPGAFPPFTIDELVPLDADPMSHADARARVFGALEHLSGASLAREEQQHALIDGGVLDNKPFGPVLDSIFHRLPSERGLSVDRKLYYIEPDPVPFEQRFKFTPLQVLVEALGPLPMYDSIAADLRCLEEHNGRIRRYRALRECALRAARRGGVEVEMERRQFLYCATLRQSIACMLLGVAPSEADAAARLDQALGSVSDWLDEAQRVDAKGVECWDECDLDIAFHLRRAYYALYAKDSNGKRVVSGDERYWVGRIIKALKLLRDVWLSQLNKLQESTSQASNEASRAQDDRIALGRLPILRRYLAGEWMQADDQRALVDGGVQALTSEQLQRLRAQAIEWLEAELGASKPQPEVSVQASALRRSTSKPSSTNVLQWLGEQLHVCVPKPTPSSGALHVVEEFERIDPCVYPAEFAAELYELDEVGVVRLSPVDAQVPGTPVRDKITGDELAHFSAFLRKDWRTNDLAWGHVDGLCGIAGQLLPDSALDDLVDSIADQPEAVHEAFAKPALRAQFEALLAATQRDKICSERLTVDRIAGLDEACACLDQAFAKFASWASQPNRDTAQGKPLLRALREAWVSAASIAAMGEYVGWIVTDTEHQNREWRWATGPQRSPKLEENALKQVAAMNLGARSVSDELPHSLTVQYGGHVGLLLWGMVENSLRAQGRTTALLKRAGGTLRPLLWSAYYVARSIRMERRFASLVLMACVVGGLAFAFGSALAGATGYALLALLLVFWFVWLAYTLSQPSFRRAVGVAGLTLVLTALLGVGLLPSVSRWVGGQVVEVGRWLQADAGRAYRAAPLPIKASSDQRNSAVKRMGSARE